MTPVRFPQEPDLFEDQPVDDQPQVWNWDRCMLFSMSCGRSIFAYPGLLAMQAMTATSQSNPEWFSSIRDLLLNVGSLGQRIIGVGEEVGANIGQVSPYGAVGMSLVSNVLEDMVINGEFGYGISSPLAAKAISIITCAGAFTLFGLVPSFTTGVAILLAAKLVGILYNRIYENPLTAATHFGVGYGTTLSLQMVSNALPWWLSSFGQIGPRLITMINSLDPLYVGGTVALFAAVDATAKQVLASIIGIDAYHPQWNLIRFTFSIIATAAIATSLGLTPTLAAAGTILTTSLLAFTALTAITTTYSANAARHIL